MSIPYRILVGLSAFGDEDKLEKKKNRIEEKISE